MSELLPAEFLDTEGRTWSLRFTCGLADEIKDRFGADVYDVKEGSFFIRLASDQRAFLGVLWLLIEKQVMVRGLDERTVKDAFDQDVIVDADKALREAVVNFTPALMKGVVRQSINRVMKSAEVMEEACKQALNSPEAEKMIERTLNQHVDQVKKSMLES